MASKTELLNEALTRVGQEPVNNITDTTSPTARLGNRLFNDAVRELARMHPWNFLMKRATLTANTTGPIAEFTYSYNLPTDCVRLVRVNGAQDDYVEDIHKVVGRTVETDADSVKIEYVAYTDDTSKFDPLFQAALVVLLASKLASRIGKDPARSQALIQEFEQVLLPRAMHVDSNERKRRKMPPYRNSSWIQARSTYTG